jgi:hypothetical protein
VRVSLLQPACIVPRAVSGRGPGGGPRPRRGRGAESSRQAAWRARPRASAAASELWEQRPRPAQPAGPACEVSAGAICGAASSRVGVSQRLGRLPRSVGVPQHLAQANLQGKQPDLHGKQRDLREGCSIRCSIQPPGNPTCTGERFQRGGGSEKTAELDCVQIGCLGWRADLL